MKQNFVTKDDSRPSESLSPLPFGRGITNFLLRIGYIQKLLVTSLLYES